MTEQIRFHTFLLYFFWLFGKVFRGLSGPCTSAERLSPARGRQDYGRSLFQRRNASEGLPGVNVDCRRNPRLGEGQTDAEGRLPLPLPESDGIMKLVVDGRMGCRGESSLKGPTRKNVTQVREILLVTGGNPASMTLSRPELTEILVGLGYMLGLVNVALVVGNWRKNG